MPEFDSYKQYWLFSDFVMRKARHILDIENQRFLDAVIETGAKRRRTLRSGTGLWRAQLGHDWRTEVTLDENKKEVDSFEVQGPFPAERMHPRPDRAYEGRVNPKGIPCLYLSNDRETAMTETRPWIGSFVSVAQYVTVRDLTLVDCSAESGPAVNIWIGTGEPPPAQREGMIWRDLNRAFSLPVTRNDDIAEYAPTQVIAEAFRVAGYDGIVYGSKLGKGKSVAVFDLTAAELANCSLFRVEGVNLTFSEAANPYYVEKYCTAADQGPKT